MDRPKRISSGEAVRWNADVEGRRKEIHKADAEFDKEMICLSGFEW